MPQDDNATRTTARERSQERVNRYDDSYSPSSASSSVYFDSYGRMRQGPEDLSQSRYERQSSRQASQLSGELETGRSERRSDSRRRSSSDGRKRRSGQSSSRRPERSRSKDRSHDTHAEQASRSSRSTRRSDEERRRSRTDQASRSDRRQSSTRDRRRQSRPDGRQAPRKGQRQPQRKGRRRRSSGGSFLDQLPGIVVPAGIAIIVIIVLLVAIFGVLSPSCSSTEPTPTSGEAAGTTGIVHTVAEAKVKAQEAVQAANQSGSLDTSNDKVEALVSLLGEDETAKLISQAKTDPDALWIAAHPDEYAFDGIEIQYKILKLAADEPSAIKYVREFPAKYPATEADTDKSLAMSVASPVDSVPNTAIPHLYQWDRRWAYTVYSSATFGLTGCGPTSLAMIYQGLNRTVDRNPYDMAVLAQERGFMSEYNGTDGSFFTSVAGELGLNCWESYPDGSNIREELSQGHPIIANLGPGYFTTNGHFFVLAGLTDDGQVIINDPYSVVRSSQTWDADFIASETMAMYVYSKA